MWLNAIALVAAFGLPAQAADSPYRFMPTQGPEQELEAGELVLVLDIQGETEFETHRIQGTVPIHAYPVKSPEQKA